MLSRISCTLTLTSALLAAGSAFGYLEIVEEAFESSTAEVRIPASDDTSLTMRHCPTCQPVTLRITPQTLYFIDERPVSQAEFRRTADHATHAMTVHYAPESKDVTRIILHAG